MIETEKRLHSRFKQNQRVREFLSLLVDLTAHTEPRDVLLVSMNGFGDLRKKLNQLCKPISGDY